MRLDHLLSMENREEFQGSLPYSEIGKNHLTRSSVHSISFLLLFNFWGSFGSSNQGWQERLWPSLRPAGKYFELILGAEDDARCNLAKTIIPKATKRQRCRRRKPFLLPFGGVAQLGEHLPCKQGVMGSNPIISTSNESCEDDTNLVHREIAVCSSGG